LSPGKEVSSALLGDSPGDVAVRGYFWEFTLDDRPGCLGAVIASDVLQVGCRDAAVGPVVDTLGGGDDVVDAESADDVL
jgi:hypothetical protein